MQQPQKQSSAVACKSILIAVANTKKKVFQTHIIIKCKA